MSKAQFKRSAFFITCVSFVTLATICGSNLFAGAIPAEAAAQTNYWNKVSIPSDGEAGGWVLAAGSDIRLLAAAPDGTFYAYAAGLTNTLVKSISNGLRWSAAGNVHDAIIDIIVSPNDSKIIYYATNATVFRSADAGKTFYALPPLPGAGTPGVEITSIAADSGLVAAATKNTATAHYGGVYLLDESLMVPTWTDTGIGNYDVYAVGFPPDFTAYQQITAVATDETDSWVFNKINTAQWSTFYPPVKLTRGNPGTPVNLQRAAEIAFPDDYSIVASGTGRYFFVGVDTGTGNGDIFEIVSPEDSAPLTAEPLNAGGINGEDFTSLAVYQENENVILLAGAAGGQVYISNDGGINWTKNRKAPTGGVDAYVLLPPLFSADHIIYAAASGPGSAVSVSRDTGLTWNQISLVDTSIDNLVSVTASPDYDTDATLFLNTFGAGPGSGALWRTTNGGENWERILSGGNPGVVTMSQIALPPQYGLNCNTIFVAGESTSGPAVWASDDNGQNFRIRPTYNSATGGGFPIDTLIAADKDSFFAASHDATQGLIFRTNNKGLFYSAPATVSNTIYSLALSPDFSKDNTILLGTSNGNVYCSTDAGVMFQQLSSETDTGTLAGDISVALAADFSQSRRVYASSNAPGAGLFRFTFNESEAWKSIDATLPSGGVIKQTYASTEGALYAINANANGGLERCLDASAASPVFETVTRGLSAGAILSGFCQSTNRLWAIDSANNKLMVYKDTLTVPVSLQSPENNVSGLGSLTDHNVKNITLDWEPAPGATGYEWQCTIDGDFSNIPAGLQGTVTSSSVRLPVLDPSTVYSWRVRASSPSLSPWSEKRSFTTSLDTRIIELKPESPAPGSTDIPIQPVFQWTAVVGASSYELLVADEVDFNNPVITKTGEYALPSNAWECDVHLDYDVTYYWKVRAHSGGSYSPWSATGVFTTALLPLPTTTLTTASPEVRLLGKPDTQMNLNPTTKAPVFPAPAETLLQPAPATVTLSAPGNGFYNQTIIPEWLIYFIGGLLVIVVLSLVIILAVVLKIKRF